MMETFVVKVTSTNIQFFKIEAEGAYEAMEKVEEGLGEELPNRETDYQDLEIARG